MKLSNHAKIITIDGQDIGSLTRFVLDPRSKRVTHLVFERGLLQTTHYVIPMELVDHVDDAGVHLGKLPVNNPDDLDHFIEDNYIITDEHALLDRGYVSDNMMSSYYYYPTIPMGGAGILRPYDAYTYDSPDAAPSPSQIGIPVSGEEPVVDERKENIPDNTVAVKEGARVLSNDEQTLGSVEKIIVDTQSEQATHLMISKGLLLKERKVIPMSWVDTFDEDNVYLAVDAKMLDRVPDYKENK